MKVNDLNDHPTTGTTKALDDQRKLVEYVTSVAYRLERGVKGVLKSDMEVKNQHRRKDDKNDETKP